MAEKTVILQRKYYLPDLKPKISTYVVHNGIVSLIHETIAANICGLVEE